VIGAAPLTLAGLAGLAGVHAYSKNAAGCPPVAASAVRVSARAVALVLRAVAQPPGALAAMAPLVLAKAAV